MRWILFLYDQQVVYIDQLCWMSIYNLVGQCMQERMVSIGDYEKRCREKLSEQNFSYFVSGSDDQITLRNNVQAFSGIYYSPRVLIKMANLCIQTNILGHSVSVPYGFAPVAMQKLVHPSGQLLSAAEAFKQQTAYGLSMLTTSKLHDVAQVNPTGLKIMQLYFMKNAEYTRDVIRLAQLNGFMALAITVDTQIFGMRRKDERITYSPKVTLELFNELGHHFKFRNMQDTSKSFVHQLKHDITWKDIAWMRQNTKLKIILKGVISPDDVELAHHAGVDAIWISNHGGRQLDSAPATIWALPAVRHRVNTLKSKMEIYIDGGVRSGSDIFKCLALGADFVFLGRGFLFSLIDGQQGVHNAFEILKEQLKVTMMLCGTPSIKEITSDFILRPPSARL